MTDVRFHGTDGARMTIAARSNHFPNRVCFRWIANRGARPMCFNIADLLRVQFSQNCSGVLARPGFARRDSEGNRVELIDVLNKATPNKVGPDTIVSTGSCGS